MTELNSDIEMRIYHGDSIEITPQIRVYPKTLREIKDFGESKYNQLLNLSLINKNVLSDLYDLSEDGKKFKEEADDYSFICLISKVDTVFCNNFCAALSFFLNDDVFFNDNDFKFYINHKPSIVIDAEMFNYIQAIIKTQNYISDTKEYKPHNEKAKELMEKMKEVKAKLQQKNKDEGLRLFDIISIVANYGNDLNIFTIWDLTVYQLYESYFRILLWDEYHNKFLLIPHVEDKGNLDLQHWAIKTKNKN